MATSNQSVTADQLISATVRYSNKDDANRVYDITANVRIENGTVQTFDGGEVKKRSASPESADNAEVVSSFSSYGQKQLNIYFNSLKETVATDVLSAVYVFMEDVEANVNVKPIEM